MTAVRRPSRDAAIAVMTAPPPIVSVELRGLQLFAAARLMRQADEDQILEGFADGEEVEARHASESI